MKQTFLGVIAITILILFTLTSRAEYKITPEHHPTVCIAFNNDEPYQYVVERGELTLHKGFDIELLEELLGISVARNYTYLSWTQSLEALSEGRCDFALSAYYSRKRAENFYFTKAYRQAEDKFFYYGNSKDYHFNSFKAFINSKGFKEGKFGVISNYIYSSPELVSYIKSHPGKFKVFRNEKQMLEGVSAKKINGFFADKVTMELLLWRSGLHNQIAMANMDLGSSGVHFIASKKTVSPAFIDLMNQRLEEFKKSREYNLLMRIYSIPLFIGMTTNTFWYHALEILGTMFYAISGLLLAREAKFSVTGAFILAMLPGIGGGVMRDILLNRDPIGVLRTPMYFLTVVLTTLSFYIFIRLRKRFDFVDKIAHAFHFHIFEKDFSFVRATDAVGLAVFTILGVMISIEFQANPLWLWAPVIAVLSSTGGGILRDFFVGRELNRTFFYETSFVWSLMLTLYIIIRAENINATEMFYVVMTAFFGIITTRIIILKKGWLTKNFWLE